MALSAQIEYAWNTECQEQWHRSHIKNYIKTDYIVDWIKTHLSKSSNVKNPITTSYLEQSTKNSTIFNCQTAKFHFGKTRKEKLERQKRWFRESVVQFAFAFWLAYLLLIVDRLKKIYHNRNLAKMLVVQQWRSFIGKIFFSFSSYANKPYQKISS